MKYSGEDLTELWETLPYGKFHEIVKHKKKCKKYKVRVVGKKRVDVFDQEVEVEAESEREALVVAEGVVKTKGFSAPLINSYIIAKG